MANERLRGCLAAAELTTVDLAAHVGVDVKTVERWIAKGRVPYRSHRTATAALSAGREWVNQQTRAFPRVRELVLHELASLGDRVRVGFSQGGEFAENRFPIRAAALDELI